MDKSTTSAEQPTTDAARLEALARLAFGPAHSYTRLEHELPLRTQGGLRVGGALLYDDYDVIEACIWLTDDGYVVDDAGEGNWRATLHNEDLRSDPSRIAEAAAAWGVDVDDDVLSAPCSEAELVDTAYRVMLASRAVQRRD